MDVLIYLIPIALVLGAIALAAFLWALKSGQFEDMEGSANRILFDDDAPKQNNQKTGDIDKR
ncbi:MAG: cbb3-type cytochrome oxidase assembly protein CcoS [Rhodospirillaceae bacterium]|nr:cbb3-type cytochrome oxidase assembly protein CcoS [Rhodospirillaceae bacterium]